MRPSLASRAKKDAERARHRAFWHNVLSRMRGIPNELLPFDEVRKRFKASEHYGGIEAIPIKHIVGSVDRYRDFDSYFLPRVDHNLGRWAGIKQARLEGIELPAIEVYKVSTMYFVKDGNHRVSVARNEGQAFIDAHIIEVDVHVPLDAKDSLKEILIKSEYADFLAETRLAERVPDHHAIVFTTPGRYDIVLEHIHVRQYHMGIAQQQPVSREEAVTSWYQELYLPMIAAIDEFDILTRFPKRTAADLYLWIMDHRYYLNQQYSFDITSSQAAKHYLQYHVPWQGFWRRLFPGGR